MTALAALARVRPLHRKRIVCARYGAGRELLRALAASGESWIGFELVTPAALAHELVADTLLRHGLESADEFDELALLDDAIDAVLGQGSGGLAELVESVGLRQAIAASVQALRLAGTTATAVARARFRDEKKRAQIAQILEAYETRLRTVRRVDTAAVYRMAAEALTVGSVPLPVAHYSILPGLTRRGLAGAFLEALVASGAELLPADPVHGLEWPAGWLPPHVSSDATRPPPTVHLASVPTPEWLHDTVAVPTPLSWLHGVAAPPARDVAHPEAAGKVSVFDSQAARAEPLELELFAASSVTTELREVLRRVIAAGLRWDEVEIVATDAQAYGVALDGIARRLDIPVTYAAGLPVARTRPGRAVVKYLAWVEAGYPADLLREMLERGDVLPRSEEEVSGTALGRLLRRLRIARGRERYARAFALHERVLEAPQGAGDERSAGEFAEQRARERAELQALRGVVADLLADAPSGESDVTAAELASSLRRLLVRVPQHTAADRVAHTRMSERLARLIATGARRTSLRSAIAIVLAKLETRVPAPDASGSAPWLSAGGHLHLADLEHGGWSGRVATFVVGLDASRFPGGSGRDALLVDDDRRRLTADQAVPALPTAADRLEERRYAFAQLLARLRGRVTLSYAAWDALEGRTTAPASELLQAFRLLTANPNADYDALHSALEPAASPVPRQGALLDRDDVWLHALAYEGGLRRGVSTVVSLYPHLAAGVGASRARLGVASAYHGIVQPRVAFDPRVAGAAPVSATQLQVLGSCPLRYLLRYVLKVRPPDDPDLSGEYWLSPLDRGSLLHAIFERALTSARNGNIDIASSSFEARVLEIADEMLAVLREELPPPGTAIFELEREGVREDARAFVAMVREDGNNFIALEEQFGPGRRIPAVDVALPDGSTLPLSGAIDRIDRLPDGRLVVIDYKTGSRTPFDAGRGPFDGGRRLQHVLYAAVAATLHGAEVARAEYHFPSRRSENHRARYQARALRDGLDVVTRLLELARQGYFVPTTDAGDCRICDYAAACGARVGAHGKVDSPPAEWAREADNAALDVLRELRG
jgi:ATP-dependent helicase/nuclease subunit B